MFVFLPKTGKWEGRAVPSPLGKLPEITVWTFCGIGLLNRSNVECCAGRAVIENEGGDYVKWQRERNYCALAAADFK